MAKEINIEAAKKHLWMRGSMLLDLAQNNAYVRRLVAGADLTDLERALRTEIMSATKKKLY